MNAHQFRQAEIVDEVAPEFSDEAIALAFAERHADALRYVAPWSRWFAWNGDRWAQDDALLAFIFAIRRES